MSDYLKIWTPEDVHDADTFAEYCQQRIGVPWPTSKDKVVLRKKVNELFDRFPDLTWASMCRIADYVRSRHARPPRVWMVVESFRDAWSKGFLPELDPRDRVDPDLERRINDALLIEQSEYWRTRLVAAKGIEARKSAYEAWATSPISH